ncbi:MAG: polyhydroxyalkanoate synthesis regulator DNA-binding domain-containing protein [Myxococcota bacterium]
MITVKKYSNRRLYDTDWSRYVTLDEVAGRVRGGEDVRVIDAKTGGDLTQTVLVQIILESRGAAQLLPARLLAQLIRLEDADLAEFFGNWMSWSLELYLSAKRSVTAAGPFAAMPLQATEALARLVRGVGGRARPDLPMPMPEAAPPPDDERRLEGDIADLRRELADLKAALAQVRD